VTDWTEKYLNLAKHISTWSKDPSTKVGAVVIGGNGQVLSQGYNGFPRGINDSYERLSDRETKYRYVVHGEMNAIYNATLNGVSLDGATLFVYGLPVCHECAKGIIQVGISNVVMGFPPDLAARWVESFEHTSAMFAESGVRFHCYMMTDDGVSLMNGSTAYEHSSCRTKSVSARSDERVPVKDRLMDGCRRLLGLPLS
jgi:dCMP deaminase